MCVCVRGPSCSACSPSPHPSPPSPHPSPPRPRALSAAWPPNSCDCFAFWPPWAARFWTLSWFLGLCRRPGRQIPATVLHFGRPGPPDSRPQIGPGNFFQARGVSFTTCGWPHKPRSVDPLMTAEKMHIRAIGGYTLQRDGNHNHGKDRPRKQALTGNLPDHANIEAAWPSSVPRSMDCTASHCNISQTPEGFTMARTRRESLYK